MATVKLSSLSLSPTGLGVGLALTAAAAIVIVPHPLGGIIAPAVAGGVALLTFPWLGLAAIVASVPAQEVGAVGAGGLGLTATRIAVAGSASLLVLQVLVRTDRMRGSRLLIPFLVYLLTAVISLRGATEIGAGLADIYRWSVSFFALVLALYAVRRRWQVLAIIAVMGAGAMSQSLLGVVQSLLKLGPASFAVGSNVSRAFGTFGKPNSYAGYLEMTGPLLASVGIWSLWRFLQAAGDYRSARQDGFAASQVSRRHLFVGAAIAFWLLLGAGASLAGIGVSFSRGGWLGTLAAFVVMMLVAGRRSRLLVVAGAMVLMFLFAAGGLRYAPPPIRERTEQLSTQLGYFDSRDVMVTDQNFAAVERMAHWQTGLAMAEAHPLTGVGAGNFNTRFTEFAVSPAFRQSRGHAHNFYIHAAAETGLVGLAAYLTLIGSAVLVCFRAARRAPTSFGRAVGVGALGVTTAVAVHNIVENLHVLNLGVQLSVVWALAIVVNRPGDENIVAGDRRTGVRDS